MKNKELLNSNEDMEDDQLSWIQIFNIWQSTTKKCGYPSNLFVDVNFEQLGNEGRYDQLEWWPRQSIEKCKLECIEYWKKHPNSVGPVRVLDHGKGPRYTLEFLWNCKDSLELQAATLIAATLFPFVESSRRRHSYDTEFGPKFPELRGLYETAIKKAAQGKEFFQWAKTCTDVLPPFPTLYSVHFECLPGLIQYFAERHCFLLNELQPVRLTFGAAKNEFAPSRHLF